MIAKILISVKLPEREEEINRMLLTNSLKKDHPDVLYFEDEEKLGVEAAKKIREHLSLKPYQAKGRAVVLLSAHNLTPEAQNSLLKTLEEPPSEAIILLGAKSESNFLPTILSRCEVTWLHEEEKNKVKENNKYAEDIKALQSQSIEQRFEYIEKLEEKEEFLKALVLYFRDELKTSPKNVTFTKMLLDAEEWEGANVNLRAVLEYLMLSLPKK
jgi:DNA polymerase III delta prime subunit